MFLLVKQIPLEFHEFRGDQNLITEWAGLSFGHSFTVLLRQECF